MRSVERRRAVIAVLLVVITVIVGAWILSNTVLQRRASEWVELGVWYGSQTDYNMTTEQFEITGDQWAIRWDCRQIVGDSHFEILVYDVDTGNVTRKIEPSYNQTLVGENYSTVKGRFYLQIFIRGDLGNWWVRIYESKQV